MNIAERVRTTYAAPDAPARTARGLEYELLARSTQKLKRASATPQGSFALLAQALHENRRLWTALAADVADDGNALPTALRAQLFYLAEFTAQHSRKVLDGSASAEVLIDINMAVMRGLRPGGGAA